MTFLEELNTICDQSMDEYVEQAKTACRQAAKFGQTSAKISLPNLEVFQIVSYSLAEDGIWLDYNNGTLTIQWRYK